MQESVLFVSGKSEILINRIHRQKHLISFRKIDKQISIHHHEVSFLAICKFLRS